MHRIAAALAIACLVALSSPALAASADELVIKAYTLNLDKLTRVMAATEELMRAVENDPALEAEEEAADNEPDDTLAERRAAFLKHPKVWAFYQRRGLTVDDVVVGVVAAANAMVAEGSSTPQAFAELVSPAQIAFARQNKAALQKLFSTLQQ